MAGGPLAATIPCVECQLQGISRQADRVQEGERVDHYRCADGHLFGVDYNNSPLTTARWPPSEELAE